MSFQPDEQHYLQVLTLLTNASNPSKDVVADVWKQFEEFSKRQDFNCYLAAIMGNTQHGLMERQWAAMVLKNGISDNFELGIKPALAFILQQLTQCVGHEKGVRKAVANCLSMLVRESQSPEVALQLCSMLDSPNADIVSGAMQAVSNVCEDCYELLFDNPAFAQITQQLIPTLIKFMSHGEQPIREQALWAVVNLFTCCHELILLRDSGNLTEIPELPKVVTDNITGFLQNIMRLALEPPNVQKGVCRGLVFVAETNPQVLTPVLKDTFEYMMMIQSTYLLTDNEDVALEACDFWSAVLDEIFETELFQSKVTELIGIFLKSIAYSDIHHSILTGQDEDISLPDKARDISPQWANSTDDDSEDGNNNDDDDDEDPLMWNLRKSSAYNIRIICLRAKEVKNQDQFLSVFMPEVYKRLMCQDWVTLESAIFAVGIISGYDVFTPSYHSQLLKGLLMEGKPAIKHPHPLVRSMVCWAIGRLYSEVNDQQLKDLILSSVLETLSNDRSKVVIDWAARALNTILEKSEGVTSPQIHAILVSLNQSFSTCQYRNLKILLCCVISLCELVGSELDKPEFKSILMPPLTSRWEQYSNEDPRLCTLMDCLSNVAVALGPGYQPWVEGSFHRSIQTLTRQTEIRIKSDYRGDGDEQLTPSLSLLSGLLDGLGSSIEALVANSPVIFELLLTNMRDPNGEIRMASFGLLGDLIKWCYPHVRLHVPKYLVLMQASLINVTSRETCCNVTWAFGQLAEKMGSEFCNLGDGTLIPKVCYFRNLLDGFNEYLYLTN